MDTPWKLALILLPASLLAGCATQSPISQVELEKHWVQRNVEISSQESVFVSNEFVGVSADQYRPISLADRVVWVSGVNPKTSKLQRGNTPVDAASVQSDSKKKRFVVERVFGLSNGSLSVEALFELDHFKAASTDRFYVEMLTAGEMTEESVNQVMGVWKDLLKRLQAKGLNPKNVVMGGAKYQQTADAIVLVKVGS
ncbi:hypothetical protein [Alicycliphilus denitrificans]|uniref:hypothetical protein n=1 Tax=Alicycliphilus denitrificans TaxID=179636 RepID=UPI0011D1C1BB|nr:hypothetical protein [Alicycliphilus denitrificans]